MKRKRATIKDVAALAGVSRQTVSRVLNENDYVADETRARVLAAIEELGYRPNAIARSMVAGHTRTLGCISPNLTDYIFAINIEHAQAEARRHGYFILAGSASTEADVEPLLEEMLHRRVDGLLVFNPRADHRYRCFLPLIEKGMAVVYLGNTPHGEPVSWVKCDDREGEQCDAAQHRRPHGRPGDLRRSPRVGSARPDTVTGRARRGQQRKCQCQCRAAHACRRSCTRFVKYSAPQSNPLLICQAVITRTLPSSPVSRTAISLSRRRPTPSRLTCTTTCTAAASWSSPRPCR